MPTPTLDSLEASLLEVDGDFDSTDQLNGLSFHKTLHNTLGFNDNPRDFSVFLPWKEWSEPLAYTPDKSSDSSKSPLQEAFKHVLSEGKRKDKCFIDFAELWDGKEFPFFGEGNNHADDDAIKSVAKAIADVIEQVDGDNTEIVVRFIIGHNDATKEPIQNMMEMIFFPANEPLVTKQTNATFYVGLYSPSYGLDADDRPFTLLKSQADTIRAFAKLLQDNLDLDIPALEDLATKISNLSKDAVSDWLKKKTLSLGWNHGKILAVNGETLLTGAANFAWTSVSDQYRIVEQSCKIKGDAAVSAHAWQDYFFNYLNKPHPSDTRSFLTSINLADQSRKWHDHPPATPAPLSTDHKFDIKQTASEGVKVLCTAQLGE